MRLRRLLTLATLPLLASAALAQQSAPGIRLPVPPTIDGKVDEAEWQGAPKITDAHDENTGGPPPAGFEHEYRLAFDEKYIYFAAKLSDPEPRKIQAVETRTNVSVKADDHIVFVIDPFGTVQNMNQFRVNANGATQLEIAGGRAPKREWLGEILAAARITDKGWECEARIPWGVMQLPGAGKRTIRADFGRFIPRLGRAYLTANILGEQIDRIRFWTDVLIPRATEKRVLKLLPFGYAGYDHSSHDVIANSGLDLKTSLSDQLEFVGTVNPDFRNIENDVLSLDFSYFERLAGESRPFFQEGQQFFSTSSDASLFASQRIRSFDAGWKLYGKLGDQTRIAFLNTFDFGNEAAFAANLQHQLRPRETIQLAGTLLDKPGLNNSTSFVSYFKGMGPLGFFAQYSATDDDLQGHGTRFNPGFLYEGNGITGFMEYQEISPDYIPRLGFAPKVGFKGYAGNIEWNRPYSRGAIMETEFTLAGHHENDWEGHPFLRNIQGEASIRLRNQLGLSGSAQYEEFEGFKDHLYEVALVHPRGNAYRFWQFGYAWGNVAGADFKLFSPRIAYRPLKGFQIMLSHQELRHIENESQTILSMNYELNKFDSVSSRLIRRDKDTNIYFAWRRAGNRGIEYYVILGDPNARTFRESIILKAVIPIEVVVGK